MIEEASIRGRPSIRVTLGELVEAVGSATDDPSELILAVGHLLDSRAGTGCSARGGESAGTKMALIERNPAARSALEELLRDLGTPIAFSFEHPEIAFCYLIGRFREVCGVVLNEDDEGASAFLRRLEAVPSSPPVVTYSGRKLERAASRWRGASAPEVLPYRAAGSREPLPSPAGT
jgi:hypothetical protein